MTAWTHTSTNTHTDLPLVQHALVHVRRQFPRLAILAGVASVAVALVMAAAAATISLPMLALAVAGVVVFGAGVATRPSHVEPVAPTEVPTTGTVMTGSISSDVLLDYDKGTAEKVYRPTKPVKLLYALSFQSKFPYTDNEPAFEAARLRREVAGLLSEAWFGENMVSPTLEVRPNGDGRFVFVTELVRGTEPTDKQHARAFLDQLAEKFTASGLPLWQVAPYNPRAIGNLIERADGTYRIIDLESNLVTPFLPPRSLVRAIRAGQYPSFDEIDTARLGSYLEMNNDMLVSTLGAEKALRLTVAASEYDAAQRAWHASERRYATKALRFAFRLVDVPSWFRGMKRLTAGGERLAANVTNTGIDTWVAEGVLTEAEANTAREQLATPEMTAATANLGAHLAITVPLRFPFGSIARTFWTLGLRAKGEWDGIRGKAPAASARRVHSLPVAALALVPGFGSFAYLASKPFRQEPVIRAVAFDQALRHTPARGYDRLHLGALTRSMATGAPKSEQPLGSRVVRGLPALGGGAVAAVALTAGLLMSGISDSALQAAAGATIVVAGAASLVAFRSFWSAGESRPVSEQAGSFFWLLAGAGFIALGADMGLGIHEAAANAIDNFGLPMVPGHEEAHIAILGGYALTAGLVAYAFRGEILSGRASAALMVAGGAVAAGALLFEATTGDAAMAALAASGVVMMAAAAVRTFEVRGAGSRQPVSLDNRRLPGRVERALSVIEPQMRELARSKELTLKLLAISGVVVALSVGAGRMMFGAGEEHQLFRDFGPVTFLSSAFLMAGGLLGLLAWRNTRAATGRPFYGDLWAAWGIGFILLAIEQPLDLHGRVGGLIAMASGIEHPLGFNASSDAIVAFYGLAGLAVTALLAKQLLERPMAVARFAAAVPAVGFFIVIDGFLGHSAFMWVFEESVELVAASFFVAGFAEAYRRSAKEVERDTWREPIRFEVRSALTAAA
ncbi:MAG: hypothetical protein WD557_10505 [Dehalococcoidia bacterium]